MTKKFKILTLLAIFSTVAAVGVVAGTTSGFANNTLGRGVEADKEFVLDLNWDTINNATTPSGQLWGKQVQSNPLTLKTEYGNSVSFGSSNYFMEYANVSHGSVIGNGAQLGADFYNLTEITGIKKIEVTVWWDWLNPTGWPSERNFRVHTASNSSFTEDYHVETINKRGQWDVTSTESYTIDCEPTTNFFKIDCGTNFGYKYFKNIKITYSCSKTVYKHLVLNDKNHLPEGTYDPSVAEVHYFTSSDGSSVGLSMFRAYYQGDGFYKTGGYATTDVHNADPLDNIVKLTVEIKWVSVDTVPVTYSNNADFSGGTSFNIVKGQGQSVRAEVYETFVFDLSSAKPSYLRFKSAGWSEYALCTADIAYLG